MKVVHVATNDEGGAYFAMVRIHKCIESEGVQSSIVLRNKINNDHVGMTVNVGIKGFVSKVKNFLNLLVSTKDVQVDLFGTDISRVKSVREADVIILHWVNTFVSFGTLRRLKRLGKPVIWVMHDMWLLTGGCHCDWYCGQYQSGCHDCSYTRSFFKKKIIELNYKKKLELMSQVKPILVMPSNWMKQCADLSSITGKLEKNVIPNPIDFNEYYCIENKDSIKDKYGVPKNKRVILFSALHATRNANKGFQYLKMAIEMICDDSYVLVVCGNGKDEEVFDYIHKTKVYFLGEIDSSDKMCEIYNIADVFVAPSKQDNYSNSVSEAMSCGTPAVAFNIGGMTDLIEHKKNGYIAEYENTDQLMEGIVYCCINRERLSMAAIEERYDTNNSEVIGLAYINICRKVFKKCLN